MSPRRLLGVLCLVASVASAAKKNDPLWVRSKDTKVLDQPQLTAKVVTQLQPGTEVKWLGADAKVRQLHQVEFTAAGEKTPTRGWVLQANLAPQKPAPEFLKGDDGKPIDSQAFTSSGAATKAVGGMPLEYAASKRMGDLPERLAALEAISRSVGPMALQDHAVKSGLALRELPEPPPPPTAPPSKPPTGKGVKPKPPPPLRKGGTP